MKTESVLATYLKRGPRGLHYTFHELPVFYRVLGEADGVCEAERVAIAPADAGEWYKAECERLSTDENRIVVATVGGTVVTGRWRPRLAYNAERALTDAGEVSWVWGVLLTGTVPAHGPAHLARTDDGGFWRPSEALARGVLRAVLAAMTPAERLGFAAQIAKGLDAAESPLSDGLPDWRKAETGKRFLGAAIPYWRANRAAAGVYASSTAPGMTGFNTFDGARELALFEKDFEAAHGRPFAEADAYSFERAVEEWIGSA